MATLASLIRPFVASLSCVPPGFPFVSFAFFVCAWVDDIDEPLRHLDELSVDIWQTFV